MKIFHFLKWPHALYCIRHQWRISPEQTDGRQLYICKKCGRKKHFAQPGQLHILLPEQFRNDLSAFSPQEQKTDGSAPLPDD